MALVFRLPGQTGAAERRLSSTIVGGRPLHYLEQGSGPPVILIHGLGGSWRWWCHNIDALAERYHVYALDFTRRARWSNGRGRVRPSESAGLLTAWMQRVGLERAHVIGHSLGGLMAIRLAAAAPERVDRLVLVDATGLPFDAGLWRLAWRAFGPAPERTREFRRMVITSNLRTNPLIVFQTARDMIRENVADLLARVAAPTLIVWGGRDPMVPVANAAALQAGIRDSRVIVVPGAGHNPMYYHPVLFNRAVLDFLAGPAADGAG